MKRIGKKLLIIMVIIILLLMIHKNTYAGYDVLNMEWSAVGLICKLLNNENLSLNAYSFLDLSGVETYEELRSYIIGKSNEDGLMNPFKHETEAGFDGTFKQKGISDDLAILKECIADETILEKFKKTINSSMSGGGEGTYDIFYKVYTIILGYNEKENGTINSGDKNEDGGNGWETLENGDKKYKVDGKYAVGWIRIENEYYYFDENGIMYSNKYSPSGLFLKKNGQWDRVYIKEENITGTDVTSNTGTEAPQHYNDIQEEIKEETKAEEERKKSTISGVIILGQKDGNSGSGTSTVNPEDYDPSDDSVAVPTELSEKVGKVVAILKVVGVVLAVIIMMALGIKYMIGSVAEKAEYKKTFIPYIVGVVLLVGVGWIVELIAKIMMNVTI